MRTLSSEFLKLFTTKLWLWLLLIVAVVTGLLVALITGNAPDDVTNADSDVAEFITLLSPIAYIVTTTVGIIGITGEFRHQTITPSLLSMPRRAMIVAGKIVVYLLFGALVGTVFVVVAGAIAQPVLSSQDIHLSLSSDVVSHSLTGTILVSALFGVFGVGIGTLMRNQVASVVTTILYLFVVEGILSAVKQTKGAYPYLPGGAAHAIIDRAADAPDGVTLLHTGSATLVLVVWALGLAIVGSVLTLGRDIT